MVSRNVFFANNNFIKSTFNHVVISGGDWSGLDKITNADLSDVAVSNGDSAANTQIQVDLGQIADVRVFAIPDNIKTFKPSRTAQHRIRASNAAKWSGLTINGSGNTAGNNSISVANGGAGDVTVASGDTFTIRTQLLSGEVVNDVYKATAGVTIAASGTATINIAPVLARNYANADVLICNMGDFASPVYDSGWEDIVEEIIPFGSVDWGHPSLWDGKPTPEYLESLPYPVVKVFDLVLARYWLYEIDDEGNRPWNEPNITIPYLFIGTGYQPSKNASYTGTSIGFLTETTLQTTLGGRRVYGKEPVARRVAVSIPAIDESEAFSEAFDMQWIGGISEELFFIFNPQDTNLMGRRAFLANLEKLNPLQFPFFNVNNLNYEVIEVL